MTPPGHQIVETGLIKLETATGDPRYEKLARFFLDQRGNAAGHKLNGPINQDHLPVTQQTEAVGHAVRAAYMYAGMVDIATLDERHPLSRGGRDDLGRRGVAQDVPDRRHRRAPRRRGVRRDFELPNKYAYGETCASIASVYWNHRMFLQSGEAKYIDVLERTLYNGVIAGVSLSGDKFFYPNPLESDGHFAFNKGAVTRKPWFDCSCCPTNLARFIPSIPDYLYAARTKDVLYVNLFVDSEAKVDLAGGPVHDRQKTAYPWDGRDRDSVTPEHPRTFEVRVRIPGWAQDRPVPSDLYRYLDAAQGRAYELRVNGERRAGSA